MSREELLHSLRSRITDERVLAAVAEVPRELFVSRRWSGSPTPTVRCRSAAGRRSPSRPLVARMCELLELTADDVVLDVGSGSGYHAALLSRLCRKVHGVELDAELARQASRSLVLAGIANVTIVTGDGARGLPEHAPYDAINVAAAAAGAVPPALEAQLAAGGRLVAPVASGDGEHLVFVRRGADGGLERTLLNAVRFVPLR